MSVAKLISVTPDAMVLLKRAAGQCYQKEASDAVIRHIIKAGHLSVLEHCYATFEITCSITTLLQLTRHRHLSFTVQSSRGSKLTSTYKTGHATIDGEVKRIMQEYERLLDFGYAKQDVAYVLPKAAQYKLIVTGNFRAWFEYLPKRLCKRASNEHQELAQRIYHELMVVCPEVFGFVKPNCANCREASCSFSHTREVNNA